MTKLEIITDGFWGSGGKGAVAAYLARGDRDIALVRVAGPNAGHSAVGVLDGKVFAACTVPVAAVTNLTAPLIIAAGSEVEPVRLAYELDLLDSAGYNASGRLTIDASATYMGPEYAKKEQADGMWERLGSTAHGIGEARAARIMRTALTWGQALEQHPELKARYSANTKERTDLVLMQRLREGGDVLLECTQGAHLSLHGKYYPYATSSDCVAINFVAMTGITPWAIPNLDIDTYLALRANPIRVAGNSGPMPDEVTWEILAAESGGYIKPEITTVTRRTRRVSRWNTELAVEAIEMNGGPTVVKPVITFFDYIFPALAGTSDPAVLTEEHWAKIDWFEKELGVRPVMLGTGPGSMIDLR